MTMTMSSEELIESFTKLYTDYKAIENSDLPSCSLEYQVKLGHLLKTTENLVHKVNEHSVFANNESINELPTEHLRFLLLPALLGHFSSRQSLVNPDPKDSREFRKKAITQAQTYYKDFLRLCKLYDVKSVPADIADDVYDEDSDKKKSFEKDAVTRKTEKVQRYKAKKSLENHLNQLVSTMDSDHVDESTKKDYYTALIDQWVLNSAEELDFIEEELEILEHMSKISSGRDSTAKPNPLQPVAQPMRPFILTKTDLQKQVFGLGYPSIPTYTLDEFYDAQIKSGQIPAPSAGGSSAAPLSEAEAREQEDIVKEFKIESDDPNELKKARDWDDWKDGEGGETGKTWDNIQTLLVNATSSVCQREK